MATFLDVNGYALVADDDVLARMFEDLGTGVIQQAEFFAWVRQHTRPGGEPSNVVPIRNT
jgi:prophage maintenance system killer protein